MSRSEIEITLASETWEALQASGFVLYGFRPVKSTNRAARGLVFFARRDYSAITHLELDAGWSGFTSSSPLEVNREIRAHFTAEMSPGQTLEISGAGTGEVVRGGPSDALAFHNATERPVTCGLAAPQDGAVIPYCAVTLHPGFADSFIPTDKLLLIFSTLTLRPGTVTDSLFNRSALQARRTAVSPGILADLAGRSRQATFSLSTGWQWGEGTWATRISAREKLPLIEKP